MIRYNVRRPHQWKFLLQLKSLAMALWKRNQSLPSCGKVWRLRPHDRTAIEHLGQTLRVPPVVAHLLLNRGISQAEAAQVFLSAPFRSLREPDLLPGVSAAADCIYAAIQQGKLICVYGDYDVDGLTGTAILLEALRLLGAQADFY